MPILTIYQGAQIKTVEAKAGTLLSDALRDAGAAVALPCGGRGVCGKCAVQVTGALSAPTAAEERLGVRLACQTTVLGDAQVILPLPRDMEIEAGHAICHEVKSPMGEGFGAAIDIGTTTLALQLYDMSSGKCLSAYSMLNPQTAIAADVIGRIEASLKGRGNELQNSILSALRTMLACAAAEANVKQDDITSLVVTGNTTMLYLLTGKDPDALSHSPFEADCLFGETMELLGKNAHLPRCLHAFVGADISTAILASGMCEKDETALLCDIGTNGELALWKDGKLYVTSTAAGPAFEGAGIRCGCSSIIGAIDKVDTDGDEVVIHTIGDAPAVGLCGSGLIDAIAALLELEIIDETGAMDDDYAFTDEVYLAPADVRAVQLSKSAIYAGIQCLMDAAGCRESDVKTVYIAGGFGSHLNLYSAARIGLLPEGFVSKVKVIGNAALDGAAQLLMDMDAPLPKAAEHVNLGGNPKFNNLYMESMLFE